MPSRTEARNTGARHIWLNRFLFWAVLVVMGSVFVVGELVGAGFGSFVQKLSAATLASPLALFLTRWWLKRQWSLPVLAGVHALALVGAVVFYLNANPGQFSDESAANGIVPAVRGNRTAPDAGSEFLRQRFMLINTTRSPQLIVDADGTATADTASTLSAADSTDNVLDRLVITNRAQLARVCRVLARHQEQIDLVVCDLTFEDAAPDYADDSLRVPLNQLAAAGKLVLAQDSVPTNVPPLRHFTQEVMASAAAAYDGGGPLARFSLFAPDGLPTIPYRMYQRLVLRSLAPPTFPLGLGYMPRTTQAATAKSSSLFYPSFPLALPFPNETDLYFAPAPGAPTGVIPTPALPAHHTLAALSTPTGVLYLEMELARRADDRSHHPQTIVFIGEFPTLTRADGADRHPTSYGMLYGSTILLNVYAALLNGEHVVNGWQLLAMGGLFWLMTIGIYWHCGLLAPRPLKPSANRAFQIKTFFVELVTEEAHFFLFIAAVLLLDFCFQQPTNLMSLATYFFFYQSLLKRLPAHVRTSGRPAPPRRFTGQTALSSTVPTASK